MATSFGALCTDFYVNMKLTLKMDLPGERETLLHLFDRLGRSYPNMDQFHRYDDELVLESSRREAEYRWVSLRRTSVRGGHVNPQDMEEAYKFHKLLLEVAPHYLSISPLDIDYLELLFGFDLECKGNHDQVVYDALFASSPLADLMRVPQAKMIDVQPVFGMSLGRHGEMQVFFEVKTRTRSRRGSTGRYADEPLSVLVTLRKYGPIRKLEQLSRDFSVLCKHAETLTSERAVPDLVMPIARQITSSNA
jgi:hypothetical protein